MGVAGPCDDGAFDRDRSLLAWCQKSLGYGAGPARTYVGPVWREGHVDVVTGHVATGGISFPRSVCRVRRDQGR
jgi:hypothetical protein